MPGVTSWNQDEYRGRVRAAVMRGLTRWIHDVDQRAVKLIMDPPKSGKIYKRRGVVHQASAPGEAPASDTGRLANSHRIELFTEELRARLTFSTAYAAPLEFGTRKMEPRPFARRALSESVDGGLGMVREEVRAVHE